MFSGGNRPGGNRPGGKAGAALAACALAGLLALTGCGSAGSAEPSWGKALGAGVTVIPPGSESPGYDSPAAAAEGLDAALKSGRLLPICKYYQPSEQSVCNETFSEPQAVLANATPAFKNFGLGYIAIDGDTALIGTTGTTCYPGPWCYTNNDPAAILDSGKSFGSLWDEALHAMFPSKAYSLATAVKVNGSWYLTFE